MKCVSSFPVNLVHKRVVDETNEIDRGGIVYLHVTRVFEDCY